LSRGAFYRMAGRWPLTPPRSKPQINRRWREVFILTLRLPRVQEQVRYNFVPEALPLHSKRLLREERKANPREQVPGVLGPRPALPRHAPPKHTVLCATDAHPTSPNPVLQKLASPGLSSPQNTTPQRATPDQARHDPTICPDPHLSGPSLSQSEHTHSPHCSTSK